MSFAFLYASLRRTYQRPQGAFFPKASSPNPKIDLGEQERDVQQKSKDWNRSSTRPYFSYTEDRAFDHQLP